MNRSEPWIFGNPPLPQTVGLASRLRELAGTILSMEQEEPVLAELERAVAGAQRLLARCTPADHRPRVGSGAHDDQRIYLDHGRDVGAFNPCFPEYTIEVEGDRAHGTVEFPVVFEGPPGVVHGGFLAVFFDCAVQHHNCDFGIAGKTTSLTVEYRRPTPVLRTLQFEIERNAGERRITSTARLEIDGTLLCKATMEAVAGDRSQLPDVSPRRSRNQAAGDAR